MIFQLTDEVAMILTEHLQNWFAQHPLAQEYRWFPNANTTKVHIYDQFPDEPNAYPRLTVKGIIGPNQRGGMADMAGKLYDPEVADPQDPDDVIGETFAGWYNPRAEFTIESTHDKDVLRIADLWHIAMVRNLLYDVPRETNGNMALEPPLLNVTARGTRPRGDQQAIHFITVSQTWKVMWHDERKIEHDFLAVSHNPTFIDS